MRKGRLPGPTVPGVRRVSAVSVASLSRPISVDLLDVLRVNLPNNFKRGLINDPTALVARALVGCPIAQNRLDFLVSCINGIEASLPGCVTGNSYRQQCVAYGLCSDGQQ